MFVGHDCIRFQGDRRAGGDSHRGTRCQRRFPVTGEHVFLRERKEGAGHQTLVPVVRTKSDQKGRRKIQRELNWAGKRMRILPATNTTLAEVRFQLD